MDYVRLTTNEENVGEMVLALGENFHNLHLVDLSSNTKDNSASQRDRFLHYKKRGVDCAYWQRQLEIVHEQMIKFDVELPLIDTKAVEFSGDSLLVASGRIQNLQTQLESHLQFKEEFSKNMARISEHMLVMETCHDALRMNGIGRLREGRGEYGSFSEEVPLMNPNEDTLLMRKTPQIQGYIDATASSHSQNSFSLSECCFASPAEML